MKKNTKGQFTKEVKRTRDLSKAMGKAHGVWIGFALGVVAGILVTLI